MIRLFTIYIGLHMWPRLSGEFEMFDERIYFQMIKESGKKSFVSIDTELLYSVKL